MKRIHLTTKPPKIKRTVFDGASSKFKTKHVRMTYNGSDVSDSNKIKEEVTTQLSQINYPADQFDFQCQENVNSNPARTNLTYAEKRKRVMGAWDLLRDKLIETRLEEQSPATHSCCFCQSTVDDVIFCQDCGPSAYYFDACCLQHTCKIQLCRCEDPAVTFLRYSLWPATPTSPKIGFDLRFMELLSVLQLECCLPAKSFCDALDAMHSNYIKLISNVEKNIYRAVVGDCLTEYNYHRYSLNTRANITESSFATECPICVKTPSIVSMDANFGLVHKQSSGSGQDRQSARHKNLYFLDHGDLRRFIDDYAVDSKAPNSLMYGQRFADATGLTDGEGIERLWSYLRGFRKITKEMTINNRQDLLTEAMLHHTEKQIWNLESKDVIQTWKDEWKTQSNRKERKALPLTTDEQYAELLHQIESKKQLLDITEADDEKVVMERHIERLISDCSKLKKKTNFTQLQLTSDQGQLLLESAQTKRENACLVKLKELATDRQYLSSLMKKYADVSIVPRIVHDKLNTELSRSLNLPTEEEITTIFQEIEQFGNNELNRIYMEKDSDEEGDDNDIKIDNNEFLC
ncbi:unnamed protein product [Mytilus coruscus]|uniref:Uncharacterized protein n=1 Tax=Mytilus coruscus TaxID=42192 RepID=A0A6J8C5P1_MYTCO|nr:unnamed protein product [Mytilus coruscus]